METGLESVTHGQCDARPTVTFPVTEQSITAVWPVPNYTAWCAIMIRQECVIIIISHSTLKSISSILTEYAACVVTVIIVGRDDLRSTVSLCVCVCVCVCVSRQIVTSVERTERRVPRTPYVTTPTRLSSVFVPTTSTIINRLCRVAVRALCSILSDINAECNAI